jgi:hypothetical protein
MHDDNKENLSYFLYFSKIPGHFMYYTLGIIVQKKKRNRKYMKRYEEKTPAAF